MKARHIILTALALASAIGIAFHRAHTLSSLRTEVRELEQSIAAQPSETHSATSLPARDPAPEYREIVRRSRDLLIEAFHSGDLPDKQVESLLSALETLDDPELVSLIHELKSEPGLQPNSKELSKFLVGILIMIRPSTAMEMIGEFPDLDGDQDLHNSVLGQWLRVDPAAAARWFAAEREKGNPLTTKPDLQRQAIQALLRTDPDRGIRLALEILPDQVQINKLAAQSVLNLLDPKEHAAYLAALRRAAAKSPDDPQLGSIRAAYLNELPVRLKAWTFEDASSLIDGEFTASEKTVTAGILARFSDLEDPEKWADWFARIAGAPGGEAPLGKFLRSWSLTDYQAVDQWLDRHPAGPAKDELVSTYAYHIRETAPAEAARRAATLPAGAKRDELIASIRAAWKKSDPAAADRFAQENLNR